MLMMNLTWQHVAAITVLAMLCAFGIERCTDAQVEVAKAKANATKDINFGIGKNRN